MSSIVLSGFFRTAGGIFFGKSRSSGDFEAMIGRLSTRSGASISLRVDWHSSIPASAGEMECGWSLVEKAMETVGGGGSDVSVHLIFADKSLFVLTG